MRAIKKGTLALVAIGALTWQACDPPGPTALLRGERLIQDGRYAGAIEALREATALLPENAQAWNHLGLAHHWAREYNAAIQAYRQALKLNYDLAPARFNLGSLLLEINQAQLAAVEFAAYTQLEPERPGGWVRRGLAEWRSRNWDAAHDSFQTALRLDFAQPVVWNSIGVIELYRRNHMAAFNAFQEALRHEPEYAPAVYNAALVAHFYLPRDPKDPRPFALQKYRDYLALTPQPLFTDLISDLADRLSRELNPPPPPPPAPNTSAIAVVTPASIPKTVPPPPVKRPPEPTPKAPKPEPAKPIARTIPSPAPPPEPRPAKTVIEPPSPIKVARAAPTPVSLGEPPTPPIPVVVRPESPPPAPATTVATAAQKLTRLLGDTTSETPAPKARPPLVEQIAPGYQGLSYAYYNPPAPSAGFRHKAKPFFEEGRRLQRLGRMDEAITAYQRAIHWDGAYFEAYHNLGLAAANARDFLRAAVAYETALALQPQSTATRYNFALLLGDKGYHRDAAMELERMLQQNPDDARAHLLLATLYDKRLGQTRQAREHYEAVLRQNPGHPQGTAIRYWLRSH